MTDRQHVPRQLSSPTPHHNHFSNTWKSPQVRSYMETRKKRSKNPALSLLLYQLHASAFQRLNCQLQCQSRNVLLPADANSITPTWITGFCFLGHNIPKLPWIWGKVILHFLSLKLRSPAIAIPTGSYQGFLLGFSVQQANSQDRCPELWDPIPPTRTYHAEEKQGLQPR